MPAAIDITLVGARRPELLRRTLESFQERLFRNFKIAGAFINIDPVWGDKAAEGDCIRLAQTYFRNAEIFTPETPGFAAAVKRVWSRTQSDFVFHLEDDWLLNEEIGPAILDGFNDRSIAQVSLMSKERNWDRARRGDFQYVKRRTPIFGALKWPIRKKVWAFTTSPAFLRGDCARRWAELMNLALDPEKQAYMGINNRLEKYLQLFRNYLYAGQTNEILITDTGREWREAQKIQKKIVDGASVWSSSAQQRSSG